MNISKFKDCDAFSDHLIEHLLANGTFVTKEFNSFTGLDWPIDMNVWEHNSRFGLPNGSEYFKFGTVRAFFYDLYFIQKWIDRNLETFSILDGLKANQTERYMVQSPIVDEQSKFFTLFLSTNPFHPQGINRTLFKPLRKSGKFLKINTLSSDCKRAIFNAFSRHLP